MVVGIEVMVGHPVRQAEAAKGPCELLIERILHGIRVIVCRECLV
jgi:hypothetical protein